MKPIPMAVFLRRLPALAAALLLAIFPALFQGCMPEGGGSDTETLTGILRTADGIPAAGARVKLIPEWYDPSRPNPDHIRSTVTDAQGRYRLRVTPGVETGTFNLLAISADSSQGIFQSGLASNALPSALTMEESRVFFISLHGDSYTQADSGKAWFPGTDLFVRCDGDTATKLNSVPRGISDMVLESRAGWRHEYTVTNPGDSLLIRANRFEVQCLPY